VRRSVVLRVAGVWAPPIAGGILLACLIPRTTFPSIIVLALLTAASVVGGTRVYAFAEGGYQTLIAAVLLPAVVLIGAVPAVLTGAGGIAIYHLAFRRSSLEVAALSIAQRGVSALLAGAAWSAFLTGSVVLTRPVPVAQGDALLPATVATVLAYAIASAVQVCVRYASRRNVPLRWVVRANGLWDVAGTVCVSTCGLATALPLAGISYRSELQSVGPILFASIAALLAMFDRRAVVEAAQLRDAVADLLRAPNLDELLRQLAGRIVRIAKPDLLWIVLNRPGGPPYVAAAQGLQSDVLERIWADANRGLGWTLAVRQTERIDDYRTHPRWSADVDLMLGQGRVRSVVVAPLVFANEVLGTLVVTKPVPNYFTATQQQSITALSAQAALTMRNAALLAEVSQARDELQALAEASQALNRSLELPAVLDGLVSATCQRFGYARGMIALLDDADGALVVRSVRGGRVPTGKRLLDEGTVEVAAVRRRRAMRATTMATAPGSVSPYPGTVLAVPIIREDQAIGVFSVGIDAPGVLTARDERVLTTLAEYAAVAIENASLYEQTRELAVTDGLTGLLNHRAFWQTFRSEVERARRYELPLSLVIIEIDRFKRYNDVYGHLKGDEVLCLVAQALKREHRQADTVYRYGGDEFMLLLPQTTHASAGVVAERIRQVLESTSPIFSDSRTMITASLGVATFPEDGDSADAVLHAADQRMYAAKQAGGNSVILATA